MNLNRPNMTEDVKSKDYTNKFLQTDSNPVTMEASGASCSMRIFCQKSQSISDETSDKSPATESSEQTKAAKHEPLVYRVEEIAQILAISPRAAYNEAEEAAAVQHLHPRSPHPAENRLFLCGGMGLDSQDSPAP